MAHLATIRHWLSAPPPSFWRGTRPAVVPAIAGVLGVLVALLALATTALAEPKFPELTGRIVDLAGLVSPEDRQAIEADLAALEAKSTDQIAVVTVPSLDGYPIEDYAYQLGRKWGIGQAGKNNGILLVVAPGERKVRIEVGRGLEPVMTDIMSGLIVNNRILPAFRRGDFSGGIRAAVVDIRDVLLGDAEAVRERAKGKRAAPKTDWVAVAFLCVWLAIFAFIVYAHIRQARMGGPSTLDRNDPRRRRRRSGFEDGQIIVLPGGWGGGSGHWSGGSGGGGWSGGGGDFGGGGASGGW